MTLDMKAVDSSTLDAIGYDAEKRELHVRFKQTGITYVYYDVQETVFDEFLQADSKGGYLNRVLKRRYQHSRLK